MEKVIQPALNAGRIVLCDRFTPSTIAYQAYGRGLDVKTVAKINRLAANGLQPTLTVFLDVPIEAAHSRIKPDSLDVLEGQRQEFHRRVRQGYLEMA